MSRLLTQQGFQRAQRYLSDGQVPKKLTYAQGKPSIITFKDGLQFESSCLRCVETPCALFSDDEVVPSNLTGFPVDKNLDVCAANAITIDSAVGVPIINEELCFLCGVCSSRCPSGAISLLPGFGARVNDSLGNIFIESSMADQSKVAHTRSLFVGIKKDGLSLIESDQLITDIFRRLAIAWRAAGDRFPNLLARNLLIGAGINASVARKGNNHMRMDILLSLNGGGGVAEVEFGQDAVLDAPRDILDALAILISRYGWDSKNINALIISDVLPNRRSEYWHIIQDINNVLNVKVGTLTILTLMMANWFHISLDVSNCETFYIDRDVDSYRKKILEPFIGRIVNLESATHPQVDVVK